MLTKRWKNIFVLGCIIIGAIVHSIHLTYSAFPSGWDGYYYVMQVQSFYENGQMQSADYSLIYPLLYFIGLFTSNYVLGFKIAIVLLIIGFMLALLGTIRQKADQVLIIALLLLIFSPGLTYMAAQFPKNLLGAIFLILYIKSISQKKFVFVGVYFLLTLLTHRLTGGIAILILPVLLFSLNKRLVVILICLSLLVLTIGVSVFPGILHLADFERFWGEFSLVPNFAPVSFLKAWDWSLGIWWWVEVLLHAATLIYLFVYKFRNGSLFDYKKFSTIVLWVCVLLCFPFFQFEVGSMGYRFYILSLLFTPLLVAFCIETFTFRIPKIVYMILALLSISSFKSYDSESFEPNWKNLNHVALQAISDLKESEVELVIAHQGLAELIIINSDYDALNWAPDSNLNKHHVYRLVTRVDYYDFAKYLDKADLKVISRIGINYYLLPENLWKKWVREVSKSENTELISNVINNPLNPSVKRPKYLKK